jgi:D-sedoheptulose 7-phosphate isomerase
MTHVEIVVNRISEVKILLPEFESKCSDQIIRASKIVIDAIKQGGKVLLCGNGGSAADSQHFAAELVSAFSREISRPAISAMSLTVDTSILTAFSNDFSFDNVFARQVDAHGKEGDVLVAITTSGSSLNCILAAKAAKARGMKVITLTRVGGEISQFAEQSIEVPSVNTQHIQECHIISYHIMSEIIESSLFGEDLS